MKNTQPHKIAYQGIGCKRTDIDTLFEVSSTHHRLAYSIFKACRAFGPRLPNEST